VAGAGALAPLRVLLVDDEPLARLRLRSLVEACTAPRARVVAEAADIGQAEQRLADTPCDAVLLDIVMPGGSGLRLAEALRRRPQPPAVVFVSAHGGHALQAFELAALDYLLKPYTAERLAAALARVRERLAQPPAPPGEWWVDGERVRLADVQWISAADNYIELHLPPRTLLERATLADALARPGWSARFLRVHRSHAVNRAHVQRIERLASGEALLGLSCGELLRVSRGYREALALISA